MEIKLVEGATAFEAAKNVLQEIDTSDTESENLIVVPDAFSMQAENLIFDCLKTKATFNTEVMGISRLAGKILHGANISYKRISALEEIFAIYKAIKNCEKDFVYFSHCGIDLSMKILQVLKQFKACKIEPQKYKKTGDDNLDRKMHDLALIFEEYQKVLGERLDLSKLLDFFIENTKNTLDLSKINLFFVNFDSFSLEISDFICKLAGQVKSITIGMAKPISQANAFIFEDDIQRKTMQLAKEYGINVSVKNLPTKLSGPQLAMAQNLFAFNAKKCDAENYFFTIKAKNAQEEAEFVAKYIKNRVFHGMRYKDFAVAVSDKKYFDLLRDSFSKYGISHYCDDAANLSQTILGRFLLKMLEIAKNGFDMPKFQYLCSSPLFDCKGNIGKIFKYQISNEKTFLQHFPEFEELLNEINLLKSCRKVKDFSAVLKTFLSFVHEKYVTLLEKYQEKLYFKKQSENAQAEELLTAVLDKLSELSGEEKFSLFDFENLFTLAMNSVKVETIPSFVDAVFVGDATDSYFSDVKELFVLGANAGNLPKTQNDVALIDDDDIRKLRLNFKLEPEIKVLNRRNRLKLFELLQHAKVRLVVSYCANVNGKPVERADFVKNLADIFGENLIHTAALSDFPNDFLTKEENLENFLINIGDKDNFFENISKTNSNLKESFFKFFGKVVPEKNKFDKMEYKQNDFISASELETFFACPFKRFVRYVLKINPNENVLPNNRLFGNFMHELLHRFVSENKQLKSFDDKQIDEFLNEHVKNVADLIYDKVVLAKPGFLRQLQRESKIILKNVVEEQKHSDFVPTLFEEKISAPISNKNMIGYVDRVDRFQNKFRIIDYKTGQIGPIKKELFHGKKLQLFLYADAISKKINAECTGVYYFNCHSKFKKKDKSEKILTGLTLKDLDAIYATDSRLKTGSSSSSVAISPKRTATKEEFPFKGQGLEEDLRGFANYAKKISKLAVDQIDSGLIAAKPLENECEKCPYRAICCHDEEDGGRKYFKV